jgi:DNA-binding transcriptional regulator YiaG
MEAKPLLELLKIAAEREQLAARQRELEQREAKLLGGFRETASTSLRKARVKAGVTQSELARRVGVSSAYVNMVEQGKKHVSPERFAQFNAALDGPKKGGTRGGNKRKRVKQEAQ